ncbi:transporter substrate-binding domain-containing protein [bacterium LRH843]|nr:transporter substrate-binding domain-containing protein [bacterium LRH843]
MLTACGSSETNEPVTSDSETSEPSEGSSSKKVLRVGSSGIYPPFGFLGEDGKLQGYEVDVIEAVGEKLGYEVEWTIAEFAGLFGMMDSGRIDTIANLTVATEERREKYDFTDPLAYSGAGLIVKEDNNDIHSLEDLKGKNLGTLLGSNYHQDIAKWNEENGNEIMIKPYQDLGGTYNEVALGRLDAFVDAWIAAPTRIKEEGLPLKLFSNEPLYYVEHALAFARNDENKAFLEEFNQALQELRDDGSLKEFSLKWSELDISSK